MVSGGSGFSFSAGMRDVVVGGSGALCEGEGADVGDALRLLFRLGALPAAAVGRDVQQPCERIC